MVPRPSNNSGRRALFHLNRIKVKGDWIRKYKGNFISCKKFKIFWDHDIFIDENIFVNSSLVSISENILTQMHSIS